MTNTINKETNNSDNLRVQARALTNQQIGNMVGQIVKAFNVRNEFEAKQGLDITANNSYTRERDAMLANKHNVARLFIVLGVKASEVIQRQVTETSMFNAKALKKVREIANFVCGDVQGKALPNRPLEKVVGAFIACAIISTDNKVSEMNNKLNKNFLSSTNLEKLISDEQLRGDIADMRTKLGGNSITGGKDTQSSQVRNVLDVLNLGTIHYSKRTMLTIDRNHSFYDLFAARYMVAKKAA